VIIEASIFGPQVLGSKVVDVALCRRRGRGSGFRLHRAWKNLATRSVRQLPLSGPDSRGPAWCAYGSRPVGAVVAA